MKVIPSIKGMTETTMNFGKELPEPKGKSKLPRSHFEKNKNRIDF